MGEWVHLNGIWAWIINRAWCRSSDGGLPCNGHQWSLRSCTPGRSCGHWRRVPWTRSSLIRKSLHLLYSPSPLQVFRILYSHQLGTYFSCYACLLCVGADHPTLHTIEWGNRKIVVDPKERKKKKSILLVWVKLFNRENLP